MKVIDIIELLLYVITLGLGVGYLLSPSEAIEGQMTLLMLFLSPGFSYIRRSPWGPKVEMTGVHLTYDRLGAPAISIEQFVLQKGWFWKSHYQGKMTDCFYNLGGAKVDQVECSARVSRFGTGGWLIEIKEPKSKAGYTKKTYFPHAHGSVKYGKIYGPPYMKSDRVLNGEEYVLHEEKVTGFDNLKAALDKQINQFITQSRASLSMQYLDLSSQE